MLFLLRLPRPWSPYTQAAPKAILHNIYFMANLP